MASPALQRGILSDKTLDFQVKAKSNSLFCSYLGADTAVASRSLVYRRKFDRVFESTAMAVAIVCLLSYFEL